MRFEELGPIIVNLDGWIICNISYNIYTIGTTRRISNWDTLSKQEKDSSFRIISARNKKRIQKLREEGKAIDIETNPDDFLWNDNTSINLLHISVPLIYFHWNKN